MWSRKISYYKDLTMRCAPGTHEAAFELLSTAKPNPSVRVLDLAAGSGAWLRRLLDNGITHCQAVELDVPNFGVKEVPVRATDLNKDFSTEFTERFGLVSAIEIIEHLDSPRAFLRQIWELLEDDGLLLISTPNVGHWYGRLMFLRNAELRYFRESDYHKQRHISPINDTQMRMMFKEIGFDVLGHVTAGSFYGPMKSLAFSPAWLPMRLLAGPKVMGDVNIYLARKAQPDANSTGKDSRYFERFGRATA